jgi:NADH-quinone oxidoreductase subunit N
MIDAATMRLEPLLPTIVLVVGAMVALTVSLFDRSEKGAAAGWTSVLTTLVGLLVCVARWPMGVEAFGGMIVADGIAQFFSVLAMLVALATSLTSLGLIGSWRSLEGEYHALVLLGAAGMTTMVASTHLVSIFFGIEILSICLYALSGYRRGPRGSVEAALKYFLLGSFASAILLYGIAMIYGATGGMSLDHLSRGALDALDGSRVTFYAGMALLIVGFGFKVAVVPFHMWVPDVYQGAPTPVTGYMATGVKAAGFAVMLRVFPGALDAAAASWTEIFSVLAVLTMVVGNVLAITQRDVKRLLAYSSIAHAGYLMVALVAAGGAGDALLGSGSILFYSAAYAVTNLGAFAALCVLGRGREDDTRVADYAGLARRRPLAAAAMGIFLFSLAGIPPTAGFAGKFYIFYAAVATGHTALAIIGVLSSLLSVYYYLRVIVAMYMQEPGTDAPAPALPATLAAVLALCVVAVLGLGVFPARWMDLARIAVGG